MTETDHSRRQFVNRLAKSLLGLSVIPRPAFAAVPGAKSTADHVIFLYMSGGMSHLDTFDLRPDNKEIQGPVTGIKTKVPGTHVTGHLPLIAGQMDKIAQIRSMSHTQGNHEPGSYHVRTGYDIGSGVIAHPALGAWITKLAPRLTAAMPPYIRVGDLGGHPSNGFFPASFSPLPVSSAKAGLQNSGLREGFDRATFQESLDLVSTFDRKFRQRHAGSAQVAAYAELYTEAVRLMSSEDLDGFDIAREPAEVREAYGGPQSPFGQGCLLARRLIERGSRFVEVDLGGWDTHTDNHTEVAKQCSAMDRPIATLLTDLADRGLLERTLVVVSTEFGRSPEIDQYGGRNHNPFGYTNLLAGGGVIGGAVYGKSDPSGKGVSENPVKARDFNATIAHALGIDYLQMETPGPGAQFFSIGGKDTDPDKGKPIAALFG